MGSSPVDTERKLNVQKTSWTSSERLMYYQFTSCVYWVTVLNYRKIFYEIYLSNHAQRSKFKNRFNKCRTHENWCNYKTQRNYCVSLLRKTKQHYFKNLNLNDVTDNKTFWRTIKPYLMKKDQVRTK